MPKNQDMDEQLKLMMARLTALEKENAELKQLKRSGRAIDDYALNQTDLELTNNVSKLYAIYMLLSLHFNDQPYTSEVENYTRKIVSAQKKPTLKVIASLIARVAKSLILSKKNESEPEHIIYKSQDQTFQLTSSDDDGPVF